MTDDYDAEVRRIARVLSEIAHALEAAEDMADRVHRTLVLTRDIVPYQQCEVLTVATGRSPELFVVPHVSGEARARLLEKLVRIHRLVAEGEEIGRSSNDVPHLALPLMGLDEVLGVLCVEPLGDATYDARHLRLLPVVAAQLGAYFAMIRLREAEQVKVKELAQAHEFQRVLLGVVGHDLRNPLSVITTAASHLLRSTEDPAQAKLIERARRNAEKANRIITDLLDVTQVRVTGRMPVAKERVDLQSLLGDIVDDMRLSHPEVRLVAHAAESMQADCDPTRLSQLAVNLITNAITHGEKGSPVLVELHVGSNAVTLSVHNRGPAIPPDLLPTIFDPFKQGARKRHVGGGGLGLGLYIVDQIAQAHGGRVAVQSTESTGTALSVTFPRWQEPDQTVASGSEGTDAGDAQPMVLVVDDDFDIRDGITELLQTHGFTVATACNGAEALDHLRRGLRPKHILLDLWMPVMDGEAFCNIVREDAALSTIPICIISADAAGAIRLTRSGASGFLPKPLQIDDLLETLEGVAH
jgi:signal transduction histidine kinase/CheY-like chemotaxis protein